MEKWQFTDNFSGLRMHRAKPASEMKQSGIELHCGRNILIVGKENFYHAGEKEYFNV
jgi:hypothetical protein